MPRPSIPAARPLLITLSLIAILAAFAGGVLPVARADSETAATAAQETVVLRVDNMTCATCPITVRHAIKGVDGVISADVDFEAGTATVVFDPAQTDIAAIAAASTNAGYPARPVSD